MIDQNIGTALTESVVIGIIATLVMDLGQWLLHAVAGLPPANWGLIGRWVAGFPRGVFVHRPITATTPVRGEVAIGWVFHYLVGIAYAAIYVVIMRLGSGSDPSLISALAVAIVLLVAPWFVMQPALGLGFIASRTPNPAVIHAINISVHTVFGFGLYLGAVALKLAAAWLPGTIIAFHVPQFAAG